MARGEKQAANATIRIQSAIEQSRFSYAKRFGHLRWTKREMIDRDFIGFVRVDRIKQL